ncbi:MAG TPA: hypothetical protein VFG86_04560, partial [Chloroflexota bacterium]|nr:hypothetical protein [Chloroflexota bacterium]
VVASDGPPQANGFDLAVAVNPRRADLASAWRALRAGGACCTVWYWPWSGGARAARSRLRAGRFDVLGCYQPWPVPPFGTPRTWLPIDQPGAISYFLATRPAARSSKREVGRQLLRQTWRVTLKLGLGLPTYALARKPTNGETQESDGLLEWAHRHWPTWDLGRTPERLSAMLLAGGPHTSSKVVALVFGEPEARPLLAIKMPRTQQAAASLRTEAIALETLKHQRPDLEGVPRLRFWRDERAVQMQGQQARVGTPLFAWISPGSYRTLALQVTEWLIQLAGEPRRSPRDEWWDRLVEPPLGDFEVCFGHLFDQELMARTRAGIARIDSLPLVFEQGDLWAGNVLLQPSGKLAVLDWESAEPRGLPARDLLYFLADLAFFHDDAFASRRFGSSYAASLDPTTATGAVLAECVGRYSQAVQLTPLELQGLRLLVWVSHACWDFHEMATKLGRRPDAATARTIRFVDLWLEEARRWSS